MTKLPYIAIGGAIAVALVIAVVAITVYYVRRRMQYNLVKNRRQSTDATNYYAKRLQQGIRA